MNNLNIHRIARLSKWTWTNDLPYYKKNGFKIFAMILLLTQMPNLRWALGGNGEGDFLMVLTLTMLVAALVFGSSYMFLSFEKSKDRFRELHMLPCSNMEKYLMRYVSSFLIYLVIIVASLVISDLLQYAVGLIVGREPLFLVMKKLPETLSNSSSEDSVGGSFFLMLALYVHTFYLLGANLFRNVKYGWVFTSILLTVLWIVCFYIISLILEGPTSQQLHDLVSNHLLSINLTLLALCVFNVWFSYKLFCGRQLIGRVINWI